MFLIYDFNKYIYLVIIDIGAQHWSVWGRKEAEILSHTSSIIPSWGLQANSIPQQIPKIKTNKSLTGNCFGYWQWVTYAGWGCGVASPLSFNWLASRKSSVVTSFEGTSVVWLGTLWFRSPWNGEDILRLNASNLLYLYIAFDLCLAQIQYLIWLLWFHD